MRFDYNFGYLLWWMFSGGLCGFLVGCACWLFALLINCEVCFRRWIDVVFACVCICCASVVV